jgi:hypothetical protein
LYVPLAEFKGGQMTIEEHAVQQSALRKMAMIELMLQHAEKMCNGCVKDMFDLTIASPGIVISLYMNAVERIDSSELCDEVKASTRRAIQYQVERLLVMVLNVVRSPDPRLTLLDQGVTLAQVLQMGQSVNDEVH